jgi:hypothetical protein
MRPLLVTACQVAVLLTFVVGVPAAARRMPLLNVGKRQLSNDTALEKLTELTIEGAPQERRIAQDPKLGL